MTRSFSHPVDWGNKRLMKVYLLAKWAYQCIMPLLLFSVMVAMSSTFLVREVRAVNSEQNQQPPKVRLVDFIAQLQEKLDELEELTPEAQKQLTIKANRLSYQEIITLSKYAIDSKLDFKTRYVSALILSLAESMDTLDWIRHVADQLITPQGLEKPVSSSERLIGLCISGMKKFGVAGLSAIFSIYQEKARNIPFAYKEKLFEQPMRKLLHKHFFNFCCGLQ